MGINSNLNITQKSHFAKIWTQIHCKLRVRFESDDGNIFDIFKYWL